MSNSMEFIKVYKFAVVVDGQLVGVARVSDVEREFGPNGRRYTKPVTIEGAPKAQTKGIAGALGERPWQRKQVRLVELDRDGAPARTIYLDRCKVRGAVTIEHDSLINGVVIDRVKLHPARVRYAAGGSLPESEEGSST